MNEVERASQLIRAGERVVDLALTEVRLEAKLERKMDLILKCAEVLKCAETIKDLRWFEENV